MHTLILATLCLAFVSLSHQNSPPGVPPRTVHQQQNQHNQQQQQQQQPPQHQQQQQQQQQGAGHGHGHGHGRPLKFSAEVHNADHILEHLQNVVATKKKEEMTEEELEFHYFKLHDYDNNNKLDGVEIGKALTHFHDEADEKSANGEETRKVFADEEISNIVDSVFQENDADNDGYVEYIEFKQRQAVAKDMQHQQEQQQP